MDATADRPAAAAEAETVAVIGVGRLGRALTQRIPGRFTVVALARSAPAGATLGRAAVHPLADGSLVRGSAAVLLAVPPGAVIEVVQLIRPHLRESTLVVDMATESSTAAARRQFPGLPLVAAKVVGQASAIADGAPAVVVVDHATPEQFTQLTELFEPFGMVLEGSEELVLSTNSAVAREIVAAERVIRARLTGLGLPDEATDIAISGMATGILRALGTGDIGPFLRRFVEAST